jgi:hypothetical protein
LVRYLRHVFLPEVSQRAIASARCASLAGAGIDRA